MSESNVQGKWAKADEMSGPGTFVLTAVMLAIMIWPLIKPSFQTTVPQQDGKTAVQSASAPRRTNEMLWIMPTILAAALIIAGLLHLKAARVAKESDSNAKIERLTKLPDLEIRWKPGELKYFFPYMNPPGNPPGFNLQYRMCVVNNSDHRLTNVRVALDKLVPDTLPCVPCNLTLMNDHKETPSTTFSLAPNGGYEFIDLMLQWPEGSEFWILHVVKPISQKVPAMAYSMTIRVDADNSDSISRNFELVRNGPLWNLMPVS
jgi:hypothetical protein